MRILADESVDVPVLRALREAGYDVSSILELSLGIADEEVLALARQQERLLLTVDKDFGELVFRLRLTGAGVLLYRLEGFSNTEKAAMVLQILQQHAVELPTSFGVLTGKLFRLRQLGPLA